MTTKQNKQSDFQASLKSRETEGWLDILFYRRLGFQVARLFSKMGITPNQVTIASIFIGMAAGVCFYFTDTTIIIVGILLLVWANLFDCVDGQLARLTNQKSELGRILDGAAGDFWWVTIYLAIVIQLWPNGWGFWALVLALAAGACHSKQSSMADYYRQVHLLFLNGKNGSELSNSKELAKKYPTISWKKQPVVKFFEFMYLNYTKEQEKSTPRLQEMLHVLNTDYKGVVPAFLATEYRAVSLSIIQLTNLLSFNLRSIVLAICALVGQVWIYFVFELTIMNIMYFYMVCRYEKLAKTETIKLKSQIEE